MANTTTSAGDVVKNVRSSVIRNVTIAKKSSAQYSIRKDSTSGKFVVSNRTAKKLPKK